MSSLREIVRYGVCGAFTTLVNLILFYIFSELGIYYLLANAISYYIAVIINFFLNLFFVFGNRGEGKSIWKKMYKFCLLRTVSLGGDSIMFFLLVSCFGIDKYIGRIMLSIAVIIFNFVWSKKKIFN